MSNLLRDLLVFGDECRFLHQVARRITAHGELGEKDHLRARSLGRHSMIYDFSGITSEITDGGIDLTQGNLHTFSLTLWRFNWEMDGPFVRFAALTSA